VLQLADAAGLFRMFAEQGCPGKQGWRQLLCHSLNSNL
jgi:hypothetical protein